MKKIISGKVRDIYEINEKELVIGLSGDTELFEKSRNINGFGTFGQHFFLLLTS